jgi:hypothetical protein
MFIVFILILPLLQFDGAVNVFNHKNGSVGHANKKLPEV